MKKTLLLMFAFLCSMGTWAQAVYNSLSELAEAIEAGNVAQASKVSVSFNSVITEIALQSKTSTTSLTNKY